MSVGWKKPLEPNEVKGPWGQACPKAWHCDQPCSLLSLCSRDTHPRGGQSVTISLGELDATTKKHKVIWQKKKKRQKRNPKSNPNQTIPSKTKTNKQNPPASIVLKLGSFMFSFAQYLQTECFHKICKILWPFAFPFSWTPSPWLHFLWHKWSDHLQPFFYNKARARESDFCCLAYTTTEQWQRNPNTSKQTPDFTYPLVLFLNSHIKTRSLTSVLYDRYLI